MQIAAVFFSGLLAAQPGAGSSVSVAYAGSLVRTMEGPIASALRERTGLRFSGEARGSTALAHLITAGLRTPDVFVSADPRLLAELMHGPQPYVSGYAVFGSARMVLAYSDRSPQRALFDRVRAGRAPLLAILTDPSLRLARTDPRLDPKGARTIRVVQLLAQYYRRPQLARQLLARSQAFPEEDLAVRVETGEADAGFFYSTELTGRGLISIELPAGTNLDGRIAYAIARLVASPHPAAAREFVDFMLYGGGKPILEASGLQYFRRPRIYGNL
jgi:molybdate/tungstate transport system substrate-binding protein